MLVPMLVLMLAAGTVEGEADLAQALRLAARGQWSAPGVVEVEGFYRDRFHNLQVFTNGVGIRDGREQVRFQPEHVRKAFRLLVKARFAELPDTFGGRPRPTNGPEVRSLVRVRLGAREKTVLQMRDGEQSEAFARLVTQLLALSDKAPAGVTAPSGWDFLTWVMEGKLAPETFACELALETKPKVFTTFSLAGGWYALAFGDGQVYQGWLPADATRQLAKLLLALRSPQNQLRFTWHRQVQLRAGALGQWVEAVGMTWAGKASGERPQEEGAWAQVEEPLRVFLKELLRRHEAARRSVPGTAFPDPTAE